jgi:hypothetical protein
MLLPDLDGCYWAISIHENTQQARALPDRRTRR